MSPLLAWSMIDEGGATTGSMPMSFDVSETYIYAYIVFAAVYVLVSLALFATAMRVSPGLSRNRQPTTIIDEEHARQALDVVAHGQRLIDYTQLATLLPLAYIVGSMALGSIIVQGPSLARPVNVAWVALTAVCAISALLFTALAIHHGGRIGRTSEIPDELPDPVPQALQRLGLRLGVSAALLLLVAVFMVLNLWSIIESLDTLPLVDFML